MIIEQNSRNKPIQVSPDMALDRSLSALDVGVYVTAIALVERAGEKPDDQALVQYVCSRSPGGYNRTAVGKSVDRLIRAGYLQF